LTAFSYSFQSADPPVVVTRIDGFDTDPETSIFGIPLTPALDFHVAITDAISASGGPLPQCRSSQNVQTNYLDWLARVLAILAIFLPTEFLHDGLRQRPDSLAPNARGRCRRNK
jgi:hypothetical protein